MCLWAIVKRPLACSHLFGYWSETISKQVTNCCLVNGKKQHFKDFVFLRLIHETFHKTTKERWVRAIQFQYRKISLRNFLLSRMFTYRIPSHIYWEWRVRYCFLQISEDIDYFDYFHKNTDLKTLRVVIKYTSYEIYVLSFLLFPTYWSYDCKDEMWKTLSFLKNKIQCQEGYLENQMWVS